MSTTNVDDGDPSITYYPTPANAWFFLGATGNGGLFDSSLAQINGVGAASFNSMVRTKISVIGTVGVPVNGSGPPVSSYTIDSGTPTVFIAQVPSSEQDGMTFFTSNELPFGLHELMINVTDASAASPYLLDYLSYSTSTSTSSSSSSSSSPSSPPSSSGHSSSSMVSTSSSSGPSGTAAAGTTSSGGSSTHVGAIVGGVVGGVVGLVVLALCVFFWRRGRRNGTYHYTHARRETDLGGIEAAGITPFVVPPQGGYPRSMSQADESGIVSTGTGPTGTTPSQPSEMRFAPTHGPQPVGSDYEHPNDSVSQIGSGHSSGPRVEDKGQGKPLRRRTRSPRRSRRVSMQTPAALWGTDHAFGSCRARRYSSHLYARINDAPWTIHATPGLLHLSRAFH
ncbi:hypothetical protein B0H21DRAFT_890559 [Amylocystis lapponica]|nr:hypothetical protein B0H21DRAFT_890559 [Amylocystis lapponica]